MGLDIFVGYSSDWSEYDRLTEKVKYPRQSRGLVSVSRSKRLNVWAA